MYKTPRTLRGCFKTQSKWDKVLTKPSIKTLILGCFATSQERFWMAADKVVQNLCAIVWTDAQLTSKSVEMIVWKSFLGVLTLDSEPQTVISLHLHLAARSSSVSSRFYVPSWTAYSILRWIYALSQSHSRLLKTGPTTSSAVELNLII